MGTQCNNCIYGSHTHTQTSLYIAPMLRTCDKEGALYCLVLMCMSSSIGLQYLDIDIDIDIFGFM